MQTPVYCDMHAHSVCSDGTLTPAELVSLAEEKGLGAVALTDHNTTRGLAEFTEAAEGRCVIAVPGCEFTTGYRGKELHILGLFIEKSAWPAVEGYLAATREYKTQSNIRLIDNLRGAGFDITYGEVCELSGRDTFNRSHVARVLTQKGYTADSKQAFALYLKEGLGYYFPARRLEALRTVAFIRSIGAVSVLAHPFLNLGFRDTERFVMKAKRFGLDGMETLYTEFDGDMTARAQRIAAMHALLQSGGSDFHGAAKPGIELGSGFGGLAVPFALYSALAERAAKRH